eukprot:530616-Rhodomonas_salina.4
MTAVKCSKQRMLDLRIRASIALDAAFPVSPRPLMPDVFVARHARHRRVFPVGLTEGERIWKLPARHFVAGRVDRDGFYDSEDHQPRALMAKLSHGNCCSADAAVVHERCHRRVIPKPTAVSVVKGSIPRPVHGCPVVSTVCWTFHDESGPYWTVEPGYQLFKTRQMPAVSIRSVGYCVRA